MIDQIEAGGSSNQIGEDIPVNIKKITYKDQEIHFGETIEASEFVTLNFELEYLSDDIMGYILYFGSDSSYFVLNSSSWKFFYKDSGSDISFNAINQAGERYFRFFMFVGDENNLDNIRMEYLGNLTIKKS